MAADPTYTYEGYKTALSAYSANVVANPAAAYQGISDAIAVRLALPKDSKDASGNTVSFEQSLSELLAIQKALAERVALAEESDTSVTDRRRFIKMNVSYGQ